MNKSLIAIAFALSLGVAWAADGPSAEAPDTITGKVLEFKDVGTYTYLRLHTATGDVWAAVGKTAVAVGDDVTIEDAAPMQNFSSRSLQTTFDVIYFGSVVAKDAPADSAGVAAMHAGLAQSVEPGDVTVAKASGPEARTVAEIVAGRGELKDKVVMVRGKVVKFTPDVMGMNWIHLRDGSGAAADGTNDVLVTTMASASVGDVVLVKGVVHVDRDFGSGYAYKVLIDEAALQQ
jgi:hypothetical protein